MMNYGYTEEGHQGSLADFALWKKIFRFPPKYWVGLGCAILISFLITWATLTLPYLIQIAIDDYIMGSGLVSEKRLSGLAGISIKYGLLVITVFFASFCQILILEWVGQSVMHIIRQRLFRHLQTLDISFFSENPTGKLVTRLTNDVQNMNEMFTSVVVTLFNDSLRIIAILVLLIWINPFLGSIMSLFVPIAFYTTILFARLARERFRAIRTQMAKLNSFLAEMLSGIPIVQLFGRQEDCLNSYKSLSTEYLKRTLKQIKLFGTFMPLTEFMSSAAVALILWFGGGEVLQSRLSLGELVAFISYMRLFFQPLRELSQKYSIVQSALASAERIFELLDKKSSIGQNIDSVSIKEQKSQTKRNKDRSELTFKQISFSYDQQKTILQEVSFTLHPGQTVALVGATGSGKTTLVNLLLRFYDPQQGQILINGENIKEMDLYTLRSMVGIILQDVFILQDTLFANIALDTKYSREQVKEIMAQTGMDRFVDKLPKGLETQIGDGGVELSTGEKQLLSFARIFCKNPPILVLDEATAAIDTESENILEEAITNSFKDRTCLVIAHRLSTIRRANYIVVIDQGKVVEQGTHLELLAKNGHYAKLISMDKKNNSQLLYTRDN